MKYKLYYHNKGYALISPNGQVEGCLSPSDEWILPKGKYNFGYVSGICYFTGVVYDTNEFKRKLKNGEYFSIIYI